MNKIYLKTDKKFKSVQDLLEYGFISRFNAHGYFVITYSDPECTIIQCSAYRRSFEDLLAIAKTYFPSTTEVRLMNVLKKMLNGQLKFYRCSSIKKIVFHKSGSFSLDTDNFSGYNDLPFCKSTYTPSQLSEIYQKTLKNGKK